MILPWLLFWVSGWWGQISFLERNTPATRRGPKTMLGASGHVHAYKNQNCVPAAVINMLPKKCLDQQV